MSHRMCTFRLFGCLLTLSVFGHAQMVQSVAQPSGGTVQAANDDLLPLQAAVDRAVANYATVRIALERVLAARAQIALTRTQFLPQATFLYQTNRSTYNNIPGLLLPQGVIPPITGTVLANTSGRSVWESAGGFFVNWEPTRFGYRRAEVAAAEAGGRAATNSLTLTKLDVANAAASAYLAIASAHEQVKSAQADLDRRMSFAKVIQVLVENQLRPGADASEADAEVAASRTRLIQAKTTEKVDTTGLGELLGLPSGQVVIDTDSLLAAPPLSNPASATLPHPLVLEQRNLLEQTKAQERVWSRAYAPRFTVEGVIAGRGSGVQPDGTLAGGATGLGPNRENWAVGVQATFAPLDYFSIREEKKIAAANERAQQLNLQNTVVTLNAQEEQARAQLDGAMQIARNTPIQLNAAKTGESQARARYEAGLANIVEATQAQALLQQAEAQDALAHLGVWQALLGVSVAQGDIAPFLNQLPNPTAGGH